MYVLLLIKTPCPCSKWRCYGSKRRI